MNSTESGFAGRESRQEAISIVIPAKDEAGSLRWLLPEIRRQMPNAEILVVDDGSTDESVAVCHSENVRVISHPYSMGNGAAIKTGARHAHGDLFVFMDADGQHDPADIPRLLEKLGQGYEMTVGARHPSSQASFGRRGANCFYNKLASAMTGHQIEDLTSGFRAVRARHFRKFLYLLPNGFSYPTTSTMAFFRSGFPVAYVPIHARKRETTGTSKIRIAQDGFRFFIIILKIGTLFSPMRLFLPLGAMLFFSGLGLYIYNYLSQGRFTNMSVFLLLSALFIFLIGILSEQISSLHYRGVEEDFRRTKRDNWRSGI
ncbi:MULTISPECIES: glycosyltransferase [Methylocaldum]|jgi:glycosyltransferase involved in cell wall biosynthesis|uniref:glycosyltransferase family 2 protein n=1 Tax=Methylocaldum sp. GT1BB TaxID=3438963 RepID=UPI003DA00A27